MWLFKKKRNKNNKELYSEQFGKLVLEYNAQENRYFTKNSNNIFNEYNALIRIYDFKDKDIDKYIDALNYLFNHQESIIHDLKNVFMQHDFNDESIKSGFKLDSIEIIQVEKIKKKLYENEEFKFYLDGLEDLELLLDNSSNDNLFTRIVAHIDNYEYYSFLYINNQNKDMCDCFEIF